MKPTIYMNEDNEHFYHCHPAEDMSVEGLRALVDRYVDTGCIKGILFCTNVQRALFDSDVWERFRDIRDQLPTPYPAHLQLLSERGIDHFKVWLERAAERGVEGWLTMRMNDSHGLKETAIGDTSCVCYAWATEYWKQHPELRRAPYRYERDWEGGYDYAKKEVREYHLAFVRELFERYDMYGLECDWMRWATMFAPGHEREGQKHLNEFVKDVRALADEAEKRYGHRIRLAHRVPINMMTAYNAGFDVPEWYRMGAVDMLTLSNFGGMACYDPQIKLWRQLLPECQINMAVEAYSSPYPQIGGPGQDPAFRRGCAACAWYAGADSLYLFNHCYSETKEMDKLAAWMQEISDPELVKSRSRRMIPSYSFRIAGETQGTSLPVPLIEPAPGHDTGRMEATITVRLNAGEFDPAEKAFIKIGFDEQTDVEQLLDMPVWFNTVPLKDPVKEDMSDPENRKKYTNATASVLIYPLPQGCLKEEFNAVEILPPAIPGNLVWAELYFPGDDQ